MYGHIVLTGADGPDRILRPVPVSEGTRDEAWLRDFLLTHPSALPAGDIDPAFASPVPICRELRTPAGRVDALFATATGALVVAECKMWRNPQARREVVAQILDYAKEMARWQYEDLQREVSSALQRPGENALYHLVAAHHPGLSEAEFVDRVSRNLREGRLLLLIVGDGIQEGTEAIARYVATHAGLRFTLALVELAAYEVPGVGLLVQPRVLVRTVNVTRAVVRMVGGTADVSDPDDEVEEQNESLPTPRRIGKAFPEERKQADRRFWQEFKSRLRLDDPAVSSPRTGFGRAYLDIGTGAGHLTVFTARSDNRIGSFVRFRGDEGRAIYAALEADRPTIDAEVAAQIPDAGMLWEDVTDSCTISTEVRHDGEWTAEREARNLEWALHAANVFVNVFRPRVIRLERSLKAS